jgi:HD-like signal output (HDOD) protein
MPELNDISSLILEKLSTINNTRAPLEFIVQLRKLTKNPDVNISAVARLIECEPNLCAQLLRLSNSAYFSRSQRINSVNQSIMRLGLDTVERIIISCGIFDLAADQSKFPFFNGADFLKSNIAGAIISEEVAWKAGFRDLDEIYTCTLLRDFGVFILKQYFPDQFKRIFELIHEKKWPFRLACETVCGIDQRKISALLFAQWKMPILSASSGQDEANARKLTLIERIQGHVDYLLKKNGMGEWDPYSIPSERSINLFSPGPEFDVTIKKLLAEAESFMAMLAGAIGEAG